MPRRPSPSLWLLTFDLIPQNVYYEQPADPRVGILGPTVDDDDSGAWWTSTAAAGSSECSYAKAKRMKLHWQFSQVAAPPRRSNIRRNQGGARPGRDGRVEEEGQEPGVSGFSEHLLCAGQRASGWRARVGIGLLHIDSSSWL